jgi:bifunctional DNA primase/polymerase-like protein
MTTASIALQPPRPRPTPKGEVCPGCGCSTHLCLCDSPLACPVAAPTDPDEDDFFGGYDEPIEPIKTVATITPVAPARPLSFFQSIALPLAARGLKVIPINRDKSCTLPEHQKLATSDPEKIAKWNGPAFDNQNVGVHCLQEEGGVVIIDRDSKLVDLWAEYTKQTGRSKPIGYEVQSTPPCADYPFGKSHLYFLQTPRTREMSSNIPETSTDGLFSLRLKNYYVCGEGSIHPDHGGKYTAISTAPIAPMPDELLNWLLSKAATSNKKPATLQGDLIPPTMNCRSCIRDP